MTTEPHSPQKQPDSPQERNEPNEYGFSGDPSLPEPHPGSQIADGEAERIAVPSDDLTGAVTGAIDDLTDRDA